MKKIYSKVYPKKLLHIIVKPSDFKKKITEITDKDKFLQCIGLKANKGSKIEPHGHKKINLKRRPTETRTQESWCVITGAIKVKFYDLDNSLLYSGILKPGYSSFTFEGAHNYEVLNNSTLIYEYKNGPYDKNINDKYFL
jgi:hypothetical protein